MSISMIAHKSNYLLKFLIISLIVIVLILISVFISNWSNENKITKKQLNIINPTIINNTLVPSKNFANKTNWKNYSNDKFGFSLKYPENLELTAKEINIKLNYSEYANKCKTGKIQGCGGSRWPDFKISFLRPNGKAAFDVKIYQMPVSNYFGGVEHDQFTFLVQTFRFYDEKIELDPVSPEVLAEIETTLEFQAPKKPLICLWRHTDLGPGFDPVKDKQFIEENKKDLSQVEGYFFNNSTDNCEVEIFSTWTNQLDSDKPPFITKQDCQIICLN